MVSHHVLYVDLHPRRTHFFFDRFHHRLTTCLLVLGSVLFLHLLVATMSCCPYFDEFHFFFDTDQQHFTKKRNHQKRLSGINLQQRLRARQRIKDTKALKNVPVFAGLSAEATQKIILNIIDDSTLLAVPSTNTTIHIHINNSNHNHSQKHYLL